MEMTPRNGGGLFLTNMAVQPRETHLVAVALMAGEYKRELVHGAPDP